MLYIFDTPLSLNNCKRLFENHYALEDFYIEEYLLYEQAMLLFPKKHFYTHLTRRKDLHAFQYKGEIYVHPGSLFKHIAKYHMNIISKIVCPQTLKEKISH